MTGYKHIFFDLDHTLWDFETNATETLSELYDHFMLHESVMVPAGEFIASYKRINENMWNAYRIGEINKETLRTTRFHQTLLEFGIDNEPLSAELGHYYVAHSPRKTAVLPGAHETLEYLQGKYLLHIITNGFEEVQYIKLENSELKHYFEHIIISEHVGFKKPAPEIFRYSLDRAGATAGESIMIGDNLEADILGAREAGMDQVYFNPEWSRHQEEITYEIKSLEELKHIL